MAPWDAKCGSAIRGRSADFKQDAYVLFTIRNDDNTIARIEFVVDGKPLMRCGAVKTETIDQGDVQWDLAGIPDVAADDDASAAGRHHARIW